MTPRTSKFKRVLDAAHGRDHVHEDVNPELEEEEVPSSAGAAAGVTASTPVTPGVTPAPPEPRKLGRPAGKRSDPTYMQMTAYIPKRVHHGVKLALLQEAAGDQPREISDLVEELLAAWLKSRSVGNAST